MFEFLKKNRYSIYTIKGRPFARKAFQDIEHLDAAVRWLFRAQDANRDGGVARSYCLSRNRFFKVTGWKPSYPETTGYIVTTLFDYAALTGSKEARERAIRMADWESSIQMKSGAIQGGIIGQPICPVVFNTGQVIFGWLRAFQETNIGKYLDCAVRAGEYIVAQQDPDGAWHKGRSPYVSQAGCSQDTYNTRTAWALAILSQLSDEGKFRNAAIRNIDFSLTKQLENGWFEENDLVNSEMPLTHTIAYCIEGILETGVLINNAYYIDSARRSIDAIIKKYDPEGSLPGRFDRNWNAATSWSCLTGNAQISVILGKLYKVTKNELYYSSMLRSNNFLKRVQFMLTKDFNLYGGIAGSYPISGGYERFEIPSWAVKFFADALIIELNQQKSSYMKNVISAIMLSWKRPESVYKIVEQLNRNELIDEIIISHSNPAIKLNLPKDTTKARIIESSNSMLRRWHTSMLAKHEIIYMQDDDIILDNDMLQNLYENWKKDPEILHGIYGRNPDRRHGYTYSCDELQGKVEMVLTTSMMFNKVYAKYVLKTLERIPPKIRDILERNGEDIFFSYLVMSLSHKKNISYYDAGNMPVRLEHMKDAISLRPDHIKERTLVMRWARAYFKLDNIWDKLIEFESEIFYHADLIVSIYFPNLHSQIKKWLVNIGQIVLRMRMTLAHHISYIRLIQPIKDVILVKIIIDKILFMFSKMLLPRSKNGLMACPTIYGFDMIIVPDKKNNVDWAIFFDGTYEAGTINVVRTFINPGDTFMDIGSNIGLMSLVASHIVGISGSVYAFEPEESVFDILKKNIALGRNSNIHPYKLALGSSSLESVIYKLTDKDSGSSSLIKPHADSYTKQTTHIETLDNFVKMNDVKMIKMIKIDVEGWEMEVLIGAKELLKEPNAPILCVEYSSLHPRHGGQLLDIYKFIISINNYKVFKLKYGKQCPSQLVRIENIAALPYYDNIFCFLPHHINTMKNNILHEE